ncbi:hypothetical protein J4E93_008990 [Alternaria ventricosa]|uniref:uncharacterized protein n=1 Tax=Alternaria ventricosa TaxID=1187951 RepID=UPI0020C5755E|nr:uncharacterized protein J4E93_008990 [Alternaria ventricosa]KAI4639636.1 hypothetical protein J4E93_008990 [Alternaria ventricosa]
MEQKQPRASRRSVSFNPEAPTFSPTAAETSMSTGLAGPTPPTSPRQKPKMGDVFDEDSSPFRPTRDLRPNYQGYEELKFGATSRKPRKQEDMPLDSLQEMFQGNVDLITMRGSKLTYLDHHITMNRERPGAISRRNLTGNYINSPRSLFSGHRLNPDSKAPDVGELSVGLGLPGIKKQATEVDSSARSQKSRVSEGLQEGVFGKLIDRALDKPLTANTLAQYLHGKEAPSDDAKTPLSRKSYIQDRYPERADEERQSTKVVPAPPGFMGERPRRIFAEERSSISPAVMQSPLQQVPTGPAGFGQPRRFSNLQTPNWPPLRPRALTRTKRTDQGPEPSHADIYPDDANFMPRRQSYQAEPTERFQGFMPALLPERPFRAENTVVWPTPAEMHAQKPNNQQRRSGFPRHVPAVENPTPVVRWSPPEPSSMAHYMQQFGESSHPFAFTFPAPAPSATPPFDIFENHHAPTYADIHETDAEMECLLGILPDLFDLDLPEMPSDARPLTPGQNDGTRYGLKYYGIGLGDTWACPVAREDEPFRVRPRDHDSWGGWQWAIDRGWGNE